MAKKECIAMLLAGGQGSRLGTLTKNIAKPAVPFGGKYRIIDFSLSNCNYSGIDIVGVLTQYKPFLLNTYIGVGSAWDLDVKNGGVFVLPPYVGEEGGEWYKGTANAIYQNMEFIEDYDPQYVLVISGDHIYKMDYSLMLEYHKAQEADATIAVIEVPLEEASRFGIMRTDPQGIIVEFAEKPQRPTSNLASMGIYIFNWQVLKEYLMKDADNPLSDNDFGKNVIPLMLNNNKKLAAYKFYGYWKDVGTIDSYYLANMELLDNSSQLDIFDENIKIYSQIPNLPPHYIMNGAKVRNSLIPDGCFVQGEVEHSILFPGVHIGKGAIVKDSIILPNVSIGENSIVKNAVIGEKTEVGKNVSIGKSASGDSDTPDIIVIPDNITIEDGLSLENKELVKLKS